VLVVMVVLALLALLDEPVVEVELESWVIVIVVTPELGAWTASPL
jgi:hypothetical protein